MLPALPSGQNVHCATVDNTHSKPKSGCNLAVHRAGSDAFFGARIGFEICGVHVLVIQNLAGATTEPKNASILC
jgi:hypothetical protein